MSERRVVNVHTAALQECSLEGPVQPDITWLPISWDEPSGQGAYLMRMEPGAATLEHVHVGFEEFLILEGDLVDSDGTPFAPVTSSRTRQGRTTARGPRAAA